MVGPVVTEAVFINLAWLFNNLAAPLAAIYYLVNASKVWKLGGTPRAFCGTQGFRGTLVENQCTVALVLNYGRSGCTAILQKLYSFIVLIGGYWKGIGYQ